MDNQEGGVAPKEDSFKDDKDRDIKTFTWEPQGDPKALVFLCHGYGERLTPYYSDLASKGVARGFLCFGHDHTGHGLSGGERVQVSSMDEYVDPVLAHCRQKRAEFPNIPLFLLGHSLGGLISILSFLKSKEEAVFSGLILMGPLIQLDPKVAGPFLQRIARLMSRLMPNFAMSGVDTNMVTSHQGWRDEKMGDKLHNHTGLKARHSTVIMDALSGLQKNLPELEIPYLILHGAEDQICNPEGSKQLHENSKSEDKTLIVVEKGLHNLYLEVDPIQSESVGSTLDWIEKRI